MTIISAVQDYIKDYTFLDADAPVWVNYLGATPIEYAVVPLPGERVISEDIVGNTTREFPFAFQMMGSTADDLARIDNIGFYEAFAAWLEQQTFDGVLPTLGTGQTALSILANNWGYLFEQGQSDSGIYQITAKLTYEQVPGSITPPGD